ncbi:MAG: histidine phosphatase family protein [Alphaproteobacteria bacterium]
MNSTRFIFVRHGETDWNARGVFQGRSDVQLNETGRQQARDAAALLKERGVNHVISSPLSRALETAMTIAKACDCKVEVEHDLIECDFGSLEGGSIASAMQKAGLDRKDQLPSIVPVDGEAWGEVRQRALRALSTHLSAKLDALIVFVGHDAVVQAMAEQLCGAWFDSKHGIPYEFERDEQMWVVRQIE